MNKATQKNEALEFLSKRSNAFSPDFGDGWITKSGQDWVRIALIAGVPPKDFARALAFAGVKNHRRSVRINAATVQRVMEELLEEMGYNESLRIERERHKGIADIGMKVKLSKCQ